MITVPPAAITVTVSPSAVTVAPGGQVLFSATVTNATNGMVTWSVNGIPGGNSTVGTISANGNYSAPQVAPVPDTVVIAATSVQDPSKQGTALAIISAPASTVTVSASPASITLQTGASTPFTATVSGTANMAVTWRVNGIAGGSAALGMISAAGVYTAPASVPTPSTVTIEAVSVADPTAFGSALVNIVQTVMVSVSPTSASVGTFLTQQFTATVTGTANTAVTWAVAGIAGGNATVGTISPSGLYTAPASVPIANNVTITATSMANPAVSGTATVSIVDSVGVTVVITPGSALSNTNSTVLFTATVTGLYRGTTVPSPLSSWHAGSLPGGSATVGTIVPVTCPMPTADTSCALYTAPSAVPTPNQVEIRAYNTTDPQAFGQAFVQITAPTVVNVTVSPSTASLQVSTQQQFTAMVGGTTNQGVTWTATSGAITVGGLYTAPGAVPPGGTAMVCATSVVDTSATNCATVTIVAAPPPPVISIAPTAASLRVNDQLMFTPNISGSAVTTVLWRVNGTQGGSPALGTITSAGRYTAPAAVPSPSTVSITGEINDPNCGVAGAMCTSAAAMVTITPQATISISPTATTVQTGLGAQFTAVVTGLSNTSVIFLVNGVVGGNSSVGTITTAGLYIAPNAVPSPNPVTVTVRSVADPTLTATATVTVFAPVVVTVAPTSASVALSGVQQFNATVTGTANTAVTWSVNGIAGGNATVGTISAAGLYTAPPNLLLTQMFTITATSVASPSSQGNATVTVNVPVAVTISPLTPSLQVGATQQFNATVTGTTNGNVTWSVNGVGGGNATVGTISGSGLYTAPASQPAGGMVTVRATSVADPTKFAETVVTITPGVAVSIAPTTATVLRGATQQFVATVTGTATTTVTWRVNGVVGGDSTVGTITAAGLYTAPTTLPSTQTFNITATSTVDPTAMASASVTVSVPITVTVSPPAQNVRVSTTQQFMASVSGTANQNVLWSVGGACAPSCGSIGMTTGLYTAPAAVPAGTVTVTASSVVDPAQTGTATVTVTMAITVSVNPAMATVTVSATQQFTATVMGTATTTVSWSVNGIAGGNAMVGTINAAGLYTAPAAVPAGSVTVSAASTVDPTATGSAMVTVVPLISVSVAPAAASVETGQAQLFVATVTGSGNQNVTWSLSGVGCAGSACGTISMAGLYTAPGAVPSPATVTVRATSVADPTKNGTATVTVTPAAPPSANIFVSVFPRSRLLPIGQSQQFTAHVIRSNNQTVTWAVNGIAGGNATVGTIDATGLYSPPNSQPANADITVTATSVADPTKSMTVNARVIPRVVVTPESTKLRPGSTQQFTAMITGTSNSAVVWAVDGVPGGNLNVGTISATGLYTRPTSALQAPALFTVSAISVADPNAVGVATVGLLVGALRIVPITAQVQPGAPLLFEFMNHLEPTTPGPVFSWKVNGTVGGSAATGTVTQAGLFRAPAASQMVTVQATSTFDPTRTASATITVGVPTGSSRVGLVKSLQKIRPYDLIGSANSVTVPVAGNQYASFQVVVEGNAEDITGANVSLSSFTDGLGNTIPASNATIYLEKFINVFYPSRDQADIGEWPDPLIPKVDPFVGETRNAFPFGVNRISPAYKGYPRSGGETSNTNLGAGRATSGGTYTGMRFKHYLIRIEQNGPVGSARFRWSDDGGATFQATNVLTSTSPVALNDGVTISFQAGGVAGVTDFIANNEFWIFASPVRTQPVWVDVFVPTGKPAGMYTGTVTVTRTGKPTVTLTVVLDVKIHVLPLTANIPAYAGMNWNNLVQAHFQTTTGPQTLQLGHLYGVACLINRISCDTASTFPPTFTFTATGEVATSSYASYDQATAPLANGSITPHGEQLSVIRLPRAGSTTSEQFFATDNMLTALGTRGWRLRTFDFSFDQPGTPADFRLAMSRASLVRTADINLRTLVNTDITQAGGNLRGYVTRWSPDWTTLEKKGFLDGPNPSSRSFYQEAIAGGDELWWMSSCLSHDCAGTGASPRFENVPTFAVDVPGLMNRVWGLLGASPYKIQGLLYQDAVLAYGRSFNMSLPRVDVWDSTYYSGGNGEGTLFYPGRPSMIGGTTHIPIESLRLKHIRDALYDMETVLLLRNRSAGDGIKAESEITGGLYLNLYTTSPELSEYDMRSGTLATQASAPPPPPPIMVPPVGGCFIDPETGNRVCTVSSNGLCARGGQHYYSYWPVWNANGTHLQFECLGWVNGGGASSNALLIRNSDLAVLGDALQGIPVGLNRQRLFWAWTNPDLMFGYSSGANAGRLWQWNPFTRQQVLIKDFRGMVFFGRTVTGDARLAYVSFDDRFFLVELFNAGPLILAVYDRQTDATTALDTGQFNFYDESVFTKDNQVWVRGQTSAGGQSFRFTRDFATGIRPIEGHHHAHGILPSGIPIGVLESGNRSCPPGSLSGIPNSSWKPTGVVVNQTIDTTGAGQNADPLASVMLKLGCDVPGQHEFSHFSWNSFHTDRFFTETWTYSGPATDPIADSILRHRLLFSGTTLTGEAIDFLARHRSEKRFGYYALPRVSCNQQASRCLFSSSMTVGTLNPVGTPNLYVVDVP